MMNSKYISNWSNQTLGELGYTFLKRLRRHKVIGYYLTYDYK